MKRGIQWVALGLVLLLAGVAGWRIVHGMLADAALQRGDVEAALRWQPGHPEALLARAEARLASNQPQAAAATARQLLQVDPANGRGYRVLAQVAATGGDTPGARALFKIAAQRAPRDLAARAWLAQDALERADFADAMVQIDQVLTLSPGAGTAVFPVLVKLSANDAFANALAGVLRTRPSWRAGMLAALRVASGDERTGAAQVLAALQEKGGFDADEIEAWTESLLREGRWSEAYARWASPLVAAGKPLPLLFNGDFQSEPTGTGFDWRLPATPGVIRDYEAGPGTGRALHLRFLGRRVVGVFLEHALLLAPGEYVLRVHQRADALRSDYGLKWTVTCGGNSATVLASSAFMEGTRGWAVTAIEFAIPATADCSGQWLRLENAGAAGAGQLASGDAWLGSASIYRTGAPRPERAPPRVARGA